jgi:hypothetical protein
MWNELSPLEQVEQLRQRRTKLLSIWQETNDVWHLNKVRDRNGEREFLDAEAVRNALRAFLQVLDELIAQQIRLVDPAGKEPPHVA